MIKPKLRKVNWLKSDGSTKIVYICGTKETNYYFGFTQEQAYKAWLMGGYRFY